MRKTLLIPALFLVLLSIINPRQALADGSCTDPNFPRSECAVFNPGGCVPHRICTGGVTDHFCCPAFTPAPTPTGGGCISLGSMCADVLGNPLGTCCAPYACINVDPYGGFVTCGSLPPTSTPTPAGGGASITCGTDAINTAIGCISFTSTTSFLETFLRLGIGIGGGIAFILMLVAGFQIMTSSGNPERLKAGQELLTSAIAGLILLVFSVFILRTIGIDILGIQSLKQ